MSIDIQTLIDNYPHLKDPLELYARWQGFHSRTVELMPKDGSALTPMDSQAYPRDSAEDILQLFASIFDDLPGEDCAALSRSMKSGDIDFMRLPLGEIPALSLSCAKEKQVLILFLISRPYFLAMRKTYPLDGRQWEDGRCPLCSARPSLASIEEGCKRFLHCSYCGTVGMYSFMGCPDCDTSTRSKLGTLVSEDEPAFRVATCDECRTYMKVAQGSVLQEMSSDLMDMVSLPLDIVAQEKGYTRRAPNPIGLTKMV